MSDVSLPLRRAGLTARPATLRMPPPLWVAAPALFALACWAGWSIPLNNDVSWQYWIARQIRGGAILYRDIIEVNPPLWFWEAVPLSALADRLHVDAGHLAIVAVMARAALALILIAKLVADPSPRRLALLLPGLALLLCLLPLHDFGEREHLMLIGALPYAALVARRRDTARLVSPRLALCVGLFAAYGFAMKPYFALVPLALELWLAVGLRRSWRPLRPESAALAATAIVYGGAVLLFAPDYLRLTVPLARAAYGAFSPPFSSLFWQIWVPTWLLAGLALAVARRYLPADAQAAIVTALASALSYFLQGKGFPYHALPVTATLGWALWLVLAQGRSVAGAIIRRPFVTVALILVAITGYVIGPFTPIRAGKASTALEHLPAGSTVAVVSAHSWFAFPLVESHRFIWPMRILHLWTIPKIARDGDGAHASAAGLSVRRQTLDMIAIDLWCHPPDAILVDDPARSPALTGTHFSYEAFLRSDPRIGSLLSHYRPSVSDRNTTVYRRTGRIAPQGIGCRTISVRPDFS